MDDFGFVRNFMIMCFTFYYVGKTGFVRYAGCEFRVCRFRIR